MNPLDTQFHRAQSRLKSNPLLALTTRFRGWSQAVSPSFSASYWDIPAITRKRAMQSDLDNKVRLADYTKRVQARLAEKEAA